MDDAEHINHPSHYGGAENEHEAIKVIESWGMGWQMCAATAIKYISRAGKKGGESTVRDLKKASWYLNRIVEMGHEPTAPMLQSKNPISPEHASLSWGNGMTLLDALQAIAERRIEDAAHWVDLALKTMK